MASRRRGRPRSAGFGEPPRADLWIYQGDPGRVTTHIAFQVNKRALVDAFYAAAMAAGGKDNGRPGLGRTTALTIMAPLSGSGGYNVEVVCREAE